MKPEEQLHVPFTQLPLPPQFLGQGLKLDWVIDKLYCKSLP